MTSEQFIEAFQGHKYMTRAATVTLVESADGYILARAEGVADTAYAASRTSSQAIGDAVAAASFGDFEGLAHETPQGALDLARELNALN